ncbi:hypothetical protein [Pseudonocardia sp. ICBG601]|uniref:hypothetical protein n=1 Tax=Pseudonocardia sp. ICBG601 TaxID=2846759 RepID=UPI001CF64927|nr:hypothetical protein [Pseudonocardia sp. ICBG601]
MTPDHRAGRSVAQPAPLSGGGERTASAGATAAARPSRPSWQGRAVVTVATNPAHPLVVAA